MAKYRQTGEERFKFGMGLGWFFAMIALGINTFWKPVFTIGDQYLLFLAGAAMSLWWIPRERHLPKRPSDYELGYRAGIKDGKDAA